jgi:hypothetical protein
MKEPNVSRHSRWFAALALGFMVLSSCSSEGDGARNGVGVRSINTNVGLGVEVQAASPANVVVRPRERPQEPSATIPPLDFELPKPTNKPCPEAGPFDFPELDSGVEPKGRPVAGTYDWKQDGRYTDGFGDFPIDTFDNRKILNVKDHSTIPDAFTFDVQQENFFDSRQSRGVLITHYRVVPQPAVKQEQLPNDAGKGLFIEGHTFIGKDDAGHEFERTNTWSPAVQLLAFPVKDGTAINSTGGDIGAGAQLTVAGVVKGKKQVDACGSRVDSWFINADLTFTTSDNRTGQTETFNMNYDYAVAPQYGGQLVFEHVEAPRDDPVLRVDSRIGRVPEVKGE